MRQVRRPSVLIAQSKSTEVEFTDTLNCVDQSGSFLCGLTAQGRVDVEVHGVPYILHGQHKPYKPAFMRTHGWGAA